ncbi:MAG: hypothetical protein IPP85_17515 [Propionivibrio sp.]|nr:hypothetical protein [Propionivibrio sp.]
MALPQWCGRHPHRRPQRHSQWHRHRHCHPGYYNDEVINFQGTLNAGVTGKIWYLGGFNNTGKINVSAGTVRMDTYSGTGNWSNTSTALKGIAISGGALVLDDSFNASALGNITQSGSGTVSLGGTLILDQASTNLSSAGLTALDLGSGAIITGGGNTLTADAVFALTSSAGTLNNVTLGTNLAHGQHHYCRWVDAFGGSTVTINSGAVLLYSGTQTLGGTGNLVFAGASNSWLYRSGAAATLTVGPNVTVSGTGTGTATFGYYNDEVINFQGTLNANVTGKTWYLGGFNNTGKINVSAGTVRMDTYSGTGNWSNTSTALKGSPSVAGHWCWTTVSTPARWATSHKVAAAQ